MRTYPCLSGVFACSLLVFGLGCDSASDDGGSGNAGTGGKASDAGMSSDSGAASVDNPDPINMSCPLNDIGPREGAFAMKGKCCYRTSNKARIRDDAPARTFV